MLTRYWRMAYMKAEKVPELRHQKVPEDRSPQLTTPELKVLS